MVIYYFLGEETMGANITIGGIVNRMRRMKNPYNKKGQDFDWICLDIETGGVAPPPKGLPKVREIEYTCVLNEKQFKTLTQEMEEYDLRKIKERYVVVQGEITLDLPFEVLDKNEIGVVTYRIRSKEVENIKKHLESEEGAAYIPVEDIQTPESKMEIEEEQLQASIDYYQTKSSFKDPIVVKKDAVKGKWLLVKGELSYRTAKQLKLEKVSVSIQE